MYTLITKTGGRQYLQLVESFQNDCGKARTRVMANLGCLDQITPDRLDRLFNGLNRALGHAKNTSADVIQEAMSRSMLKLAGARLLGSVHG